MSFFSLPITEMARFIQISSSKALHNLSLQGETVVTLHYKEPRASGPHSFKLKLLVRSDVLTLLFTLANPHAGVSVPAFRSSWTNYPPPLLYTAQETQHKTTALFFSSIGWNDLWMIHSKIISSSSQKQFLSVYVQETSK